MSRSHGIAARHGVVVSLVVLIFLAATVVVLIIYSLHVCHQVGSRNVGNVSYWALLLHFVLLRIMIRRSIINII